MSSRNNASVPRLLAEIVPTIFNFLVNLILDDRIYAFNEIISNL